MHVEFMPADAPDPDGQISAAPAKVTAELFELCDEFLRQGQPNRPQRAAPVPTERGRHGGLGWFLDALGFTALASRGEAIEDSRHAV
jgi:hypothetical protein